MACEEMKLFARLVPVLSMLVENQKNNDSAGCFQPFTSILKNKNEISL